LPLVLSLGTTEQSLVLSSWPPPCRYLEAFLRSPLCPEEQDQQWAALQSSAAHRQPPRGLVWVPTQHLISANRHWAHSHLVFDAPLVIRYQRSVLNNSRTPHLTPTSATTDVD